MIHKRILRFGFTYDVCTRIYIYTFMHIFENLYNV